MTEIKARTTMYKGMTIEETIDLLTVAAAFDRRTIGEGDAVAWHAALGDLDFTDSREAVVAHYRERREWIMPADVRGRVRAIRDKRLNEGEKFLDPPSGLDGPAYQQWLINARRRIADGTDRPRALEMS